MIGRIYHVGLTVSDLDRSVAFYRDILGLAFQGEIFMEGKETDKMFRKSNCKARVAYLNGSKAIETPPVELIQFVDSEIHKEQSDLFTTSISEVCFYTDDIDSVYKTLIENHVECLSEPQPFDFTADGFGKKYVDGLINDLKNGTYKPKPARRIYIPKANGKERPLSIPSFRDKLLQEVIRMFLEAIYEPNFSDFSHGFRPNRSCHTALKQAKIYFTGAKWFVEGDIKGCFDNIDHDKLIEILQRKIKDSKFINIIRLMLKAGYVEDFKYHETYSGTPQGGILSPILANIYLNELDMKLEEIQNRFKKPHERKYTYEYSVMKGRRDYQKAKLKKAKEDEKAEILDRIEEYTKALYGIPRTPADDKNLYFVRYADDFLIGIKGSKEDCIAIKAELTEFLKKELKLTLSEEKTLITHSSKKALFLGYNVSVRRSNVIKQNGQGYKQRTLNNKVELSIPFERIEKFMFDRGIIRQTESKKFKPVHRKGWLYLPDYVIVQRYNEEMRGVLNYYNLAVDYNRLGYFRYLMEYSCLATLAGKHLSLIHI